MNKIKMVFLICSSLGCYAQKNQGIQSDLNFETSSFMQKSAYHSPSHIAPEEDLNADGAMSHVNRLWDSTREGKWYIEEQRYGYDAIAAGLANKDTVAINRGIRIFTWGFKQQQTDGSFDCPDAFHSTSFFLEATAHASLLLRASDYSEIYQPYVEQFKIQILKAAQWMTRADIELSGKQRNIPYTHRRYLVAAALGEAGILTGDKLLIDRARDYIKEGIALQDPSGFNPEKGGYDCSYHAVGLVYAERYYDIVANDTDKKRLFAMLQNGIRWLSTRVKNDGTIDATGNTRTGLGQEKGRNDNVKTINYGQIFRAFYRWSVQCSDSSYGELALKVVNGKKIEDHRMKIK